MTEAHTDTMEPESTPQSNAPTRRKDRKRREGVVVSDACNKTVKVLHEFTQRHPKYGKIVRRRATLHVHDEKNEARVGDVVEVMACRPISKQKSWRLVRVVSRAPEGR
jgi:small subunit ribosomal protein S17